MRLINILYVWIIVIYLCKINTNIALFSVSKNDIYTIYYLIFSSP